VDRVASLIVEPSLQWSFLILVVFEERALIHLAASASKTGTAIGILDCSPQQTRGVVSLADQTSELFRNFNVMSIKSTFSLMISAVVKEPLHSQPV
jgi:hypothetical protein